LIVRASAGSGKTFRLVQEYLRCCLRTDDPTYFRKILAITFTNKAAQEMKDRVLREVQAVAEGEGVMFEKLQEVLEVAPEEMQRRAEQLGQSMLFRYEDFGVMTIDSFVNRLVRSFARDLEWDDAFQIQLDEDELIDQAVGRVLNRVGLPGEEALTSMMEGFVRQQVEEERNTMLRAQLIKFGKQVTREHMQPVLRALPPDEWPTKRFGAYRTEIAAHLKRLYAGPVEAAMKAQKAIQDAGLSDSDFSYGALPKWFEKILAGQGRKATLGDRLTRQFESDGFGKAKTSAATLQTLEGLAPVFLKVREAWEGVYDGEEGQKNKLLDHLQERVSLIGTLALIRDALEEVQVESNVRLLSSLNREIAELVRNNPAPYIFERLGNRYQHIFIDEFQDTSITQWHNLVQLFEHILSTQHMGMVVGDGKQAIYRWRNGNYEQLQALPDLIDDPGPVLLEAAESLKRNAKPLHLENNFRSGKAIVGWNNRLFRHVQGLLPPDLQSVYGAPDQVAMKSFNGAVHVASLVDKKVGDRERQRHEWVLQRILAHTGGQLVKVGDRMQFEAVESADHFNLSDLAVLMRKNRDGAALAQFLLDHGITPFTTESLHLGRHPAPRGVIALLRSILDPLNPVHVIDFLQCYTALHPEVDEAAWLWEHHEIESYVSADGQERERGKVRTEALLQKLVPTLQLEKRSAEPLVALVGHCFDVLGWSESHPAYAEGLLELAHEVSNHRRSGLPAFIATWDRSGYKRSIRVSGAQDAVQIMTPHKAKGLAFPVVIAPMVHDKIATFKDELPVLLDAKKYGLPAALLRDADLKNTELDSERQREIDRTLLDALNVAYVTMTRPIERLDVLLEFEAEGVHEEGPKSLPQLLLQSIEEEFSGQRSAEGTWNLGAADRKPQDEGAPDSALKTRETHLKSGGAIRAIVARPKGAWSEAMPGGALSQRTYGNAVHGLLAQVGELADWNSIQPRLGSSFGMDAAQRDEVIEAVEAVLLHEEWSRFFETPSDQRFTERPLRLTSGDVGRPDRVVKLEDGWHVLDYKTGAPEKKHHAQVNAYMQAIAEMEPAEKVHGWLLYTRELKLVRVD
jgi:ATP-dependent exoDNAse (exonuclease V) beta subunit